ncbi:MAG: DUF2784 domain-containing protein [Pseudomonadota bacterium]
MWLVASRTLMFLHFAFLAFLFVGGWLGLFWQPLFWAHCLALVYAIVISILGAPCPLTKAEQALLRRAGRTAYSGDFLPHYVWSWLPCRGDEPWLLGGALAAAAAINSYPYARWLAP